MTEVSWKTSKKTSIFIFNVGRGVSIFIRTPSNHGVIYDLGSSADFSPSEFLQENILSHLDKFIVDEKTTKPLMQTIISHPHLDHISEIEKLEDSEFDAALHTCPHDNYASDASEKTENLDWTRINNPSGSDDKIKTYKNLYKDRNPPLQTPNFKTVANMPIVECGLYYVRPSKVSKIFPKDDQEYTNGVSLVFYYKHGKHSILIPGDINPDTLRVLIKEYPGFEKRYTTTASKNPEWSKKNSNQPSLKKLLGQGLSILIAPHHGLKSGYSEDLYNEMKDEKPDLVVVSEKRHTGKNDGQIHENYQSSKGAKGLEVTIDGDSKKVYSVTTRNNHHILVSFSDDKTTPQVFLDKDPKKLLAKM